MSLGVPGYCTKLPLENMQVLGAFAKLRQTTTSIVMSVHLSDCMHRTLLPMDGFSRNLKSENFSKFC